MKLHSHSHHPHSETGTSTTQLSKTTPTAVATTTQLDPTSPSLSLFPDSLDSQTTIHTLALEKTPNHKYAAALGGFDIVTSPSTKAMMTSTEQQPNIHDDTLLPAKTSPLADDPCSFSSSTLKLSPSTSTSSNSSFSDTSCAPLKRSPSNVETYPSMQDTSPSSRQASYRTVDDPLNGCHCLQHHHLSPSAPSSSPPPSLSCETDVRAMASCFTQNTESQDSLLSEALEQEHQEQEQEQECLRYPASHSNQLQHPHIIYPRSPHDHDSQDISDLASPKVNVTRSLMRDVPLSPLSPHDENPMVDRVTKNHVKADSLEEATSTPCTRGPISIKRRKMSEDEECHASDPSCSTTLPSDYPSPPLSASSTSSSSSSFSCSSPSTETPSWERLSWSSKKRRSILSTSSSTSDPTSRITPTIPTTPATPVTPTSSTSSFLSNVCTNFEWTDCSSLGLLSETSALVSTSYSNMATSSSLALFERNANSAIPLFSLQHLQKQQLVQQHQPSVSTPPQTRRETLAPTPLAKDRKRSFDDAIEMMRPLGSSEITADLSGWFESVKRRKIHHYPTRWTSSLAPSPYVKLLAMRDFWDMMMDRVDLSWLNFWKISALPSRLRGFGDKEEEEEDAFCDEEEGSEDMDEEETKDQSLQTRPRTKKKSSKILVQYPNPGLFLKGLWEEEEKHRRKQQMIPDNVHKPIRSKILNGKPISRMNLTKSGSWMKSKASRSLFLGSNSASTPSLSSSSSSSSSSSTCSSSSSSTSKDETGADMEGNVSKEETPQETTTQKGVDYDDLKKKASRSHALSEGCDLTEYKPWKDGTVTPSRGSIKTLCEMRNTMLDPWPAEESKARDECTRILHRMREQLNVVINLQIHLRTMMKTAPTHMSFLLSIRHPGQVSIELLRALYGPQFMQTSAFRTIEQLLWGKHPTPSPSSQNFESSYQGRPSHRHYRQQTHHGHHHHHFQQQARPEEDEDAECEFEERFDDAYQDPIVDLDHNVVVDSRMEDEEEEMDDGPVGRHHGEECVALSIRS